MPTWHVFDEETASALRDQNVDGSVAFAGASADLLLNTDAVVIAPTKFHGEVFLLTARHRVTEAPIFTPAAPPESQIYVEAAETPTLKPAVQAVEDAIQPDIVDEPEQYFGPTTWERLDQ